jgi:hypothetical protein
VDGVLVSAEELGVVYQYHSSYAAAVHDSAWVYITTDEGVAAAYASRYIGGGPAVPGDLYEVQPLDAPQLDPDYVFFPDGFFRCRPARITRRVASGVSLTSMEQRERERRYRVWASADDPVWDDDGVLNPSRQMRDNGVTREWTGMLRPWLNPEDIDAAGKLAVVFRVARGRTLDGETWRTILEVIPALDRDCQVQLVRDRGSRNRSYQCLTCDQELGDRDQAVVHQLGDHAVDALARIHEWNTLTALPEVLKGLTRAAIRRNRPRWQWLLDELV